MMYVTGSNFDPNKKQVKERSVTLFTGWANVEVLRFNPSKKEIHELTGRPLDRIPDWECEYNSQYGSKVTALCVLYAREEMKRQHEIAGDVKDDTFYESLPEKYFVKIELLLSKEEILSSKTGKKLFISRLINPKKQVWAKDEAEARSDKFKWATGDYDFEVTDPNGGKPKSEPRKNYVRTLKKGENALLQLLASNFNVIDTNKQPLAFLLIDSADEDETHHYERYDEILEGNVDYLNAFLESPLVKFGDKKLKISCMFGAKPSNKVNDNGIPYFNQTVLAYGAAPFGKENSFPSSTLLNDLERGIFNAMYQDSTVFQLFDPSVVLGRSANDTTDSSTIEVDNDVASEDIADDDLPF